MDREEKDAQLKEFIQRLSSTTFKGATDPNIKDSIETLRHIYENEYRHMYSSIFATISQNTEEQNSGLAQNIKYVCAVAQKEESSKELKKSITKLYDHINLEVSHCSFFMGATNQKFLSKRIKFMEDKFNPVIVKLQKIQSEYITILGIFASIVLTFIAGLTFSSSVLENVEKASIYRLMLVITAIAFTIVNSIHILVSLIQKIIGHDTKLYDIKSFNIFCFIVVVFILIAWLLNAHKLASYFSQWFPWTW